MEGKAKKERDDKNLRISILILLVAGFVLLLSLATSFIQAQTGLEGQSLEVSPPTQEVSVQPGEAVEITSRIRNRSDDILPIKARLEDFIATGDEGAVALTEKGPWAVSTWTTLTPTEFSLKPNEQKEVTATVRIPETGAVGGRYGSFVFSVTGEAVGTAAVISQEVASLFLIDIAGEKQEKLILESFTAPSFLEFGPVEFTLTYNNTGNIHLRPHGVVTVSDMFGRKVADLTITGTNVFPGSKRTVFVSWDKKFLFGKFSGQAILYTGGTKNESMNGVITFTVIPLRLVAIVLIVLVVLFLIRERLLKAIRALAGK